MLHANCHIGFLANKVSDFGGSKGTSIRAGPSSHSIKKDPEDISDRKQRENILIVSTCTSAQ